MIDDQEVDLTVFTSRCKTSWASPGNGTANPNLNICLQEWYVCMCVFVCVRAHVLGRVARDDGVCLAGWLSNNQVKCPIMSIP